MDNEYTVQEIKQYLARVTEEEQSANNQLLELFGNKDVPEDAKAHREKISGLLVKSIITPSLPYHDAMNDVEESIISASASKIMLLASGVEKEICVGDTPVRLLMKRHHRAIRTWLGNDHGDNYLFSDYEGKLRNLLMVVIGIRNIVDVIEKFDESIGSLQGGDLINKPGNILLIEEIIRTDKRLRFGIQANISNNEVLEIFEAKLKDINKKLKGQKA